jgi:uncharacterized protein YrrD
MEVTMLYSVRQLDGKTLAASDGEIGHAREVYLDDQRWVIRHVVAQTGVWLFGRKVLISPHSIVRIDAEGGRLEVALTQQQIKDAPDIDTDKPVSRQRETSYYDYYGYPYYWGGPGLWGLSAYPMAAAVAPTHDAGVDRVAEEAAAAERRSADPHLRSSKEITGYNVEASDGSIGHLEDFLFDERSWQVRYVVVDTRTWLPGRHVLVPPQWITDIDFNERRATVKVPRAAVEASPPYEPRARLPEEDVSDVQRHFEGWQ